jgi:uncharacterized membrane protein
MHSVLFFLLYLLSFLYFVLAVCFQLAASVFPAISAVLLTLIQPGEVKDDLADFRAILHTKVLSVRKFK